MRAASHGLVFAFAVMMAACGTTPSGQDAGTNKDAGGGGQDSGAGQDAGTAQDAGTGQDAGTAVSCVGKTPASAAITVSDSCPAYTKCGGNPQGLWYYTDGCITNPMNAVKAACSTATFKNMTGTVTGCVAFTATNVNRIATWSVSGTVSLPASCVYVDCATTQGAVRQYLPGATCTAAGTGCDCSGTVSNNVNQTALYTINGDNTLTAGTIVYEYCVAGTTMTHHEQGTTPAEPGQFTVTKQ